MRRTTKYVGLDVHQASTVASVREASGRVIARSELPTEAGALTEFVRGMRGAVHLTFEEGTQAQWLHDLLTPLVDRVIVCDRRGAARQGNKGDQVDADQVTLTRKLAALTLHLWKRGERFDPTQLMAPAREHRS
jgi:transposase